jgi:hypothetical protein
MEKCVRRSDTPHDAAKPRRADAPCLAMSKSLVLAIAWTDTEYGRFS